MGEFMVDPHRLRRCFGSLLLHLDERQRRLAAGLVAGMLGRRGITAVAKASPECTHQIRAMLLRP